MESLQPNVLSKVFSTNLTVLSSVDTSVTHGPYCFNQIIPVSNLRDGVIRREPGMSTRQKM